jgi:hypothetical protein
MEIYDRHWVSAGGEIQTLIQTDEKVRRDIESAMADIFLAMRRDLRSTQVSESIARDYMHFYQCGMLASDREAPQLVP